MVNQELCNKCQHETSLLSTSYQSLISLCAKSNLLLRFPLYLMDFLSPSYFLVFLFLLLYLKKEKKLKRITLTNQVVHDIMREREVEIFPLEMQIMTWTIYKAAHQLIRPVRENKQLGTISYSLIGSFTQFIQCLFQGTFNSFPYIKKCW